MSHRRSPRQPAAPSPALWTALCAASIPLALLYPAEVAAEGPPPRPPVDAGADWDPGDGPPPEPCPSARIEPCEGAGCPEQACTPDQIAVVACVLAECGEPVDDPGCTYYCCDGQAWRYQGADPDPCGAPQPDDDAAADPDGMAAADGAAEADGAAPDDGAVVLDAVADIGEPAPPEPAASDGCAAGRPSPTGWLAGLGALLIASALRRRLGGG